ncbi:MAG: M48 family metalloprotease [Betaproteobacteria bacterium]|nr:M48 family metalloprotease [Betaproteobacteria bacterium]
MAMTAAYSSATRGRLLGLPATACVAFLVCACASAPQNPVRAFWLPASQDAWAKAPAGGASLRKPDGTTRFVPGPVLRNVVTAKEKLEQASSVRAGLGLVEMDAPNAFALNHQGQPLIAFSLSWLDQLGKDPDALATTIGHELAHLHLGHTGEARKQREESAQGASQVLGTLLNLAGVPFGGTIASIGVTAFTRSFTRDEERAADDYGIRWAVAAGYNPCGRSRTMQVYRRLSAGSLDIPFLSTHPGAAERSELANEYSLKLNNRVCEE